MAIHKLDKITAARIAAGEVVDRPSAIVRELVDNAIDSGATKIIVNLEEGGIKNVTVSDNGQGITKEDLPLAFESHATSKIQNIDDLFNLRSLGFRGEALYSISSCTKLTISSQGNKLTVNNGQYGQIMPGAITQGTTVTAEDLFENIPARKQFLRRPSTEYNECKKIFIEKTFCYENIEFILLNSNKIDLHLKPCTRKQRIIDILSTDKNFIPTETIEMKEQQESVQLYALSSMPSVYKKDRTQIKIFINGRIIDNFLMVKVITNSFSAVLPGGAFPYFYLFIENNPELVDFNIHPTKRECKIRNQSAIHALLSGMIRNSLIAVGKKQAQSFSPWQPTVELYEQENIPAPAPTTYSKEEFITNKPLNPHPSFVYKETATAYIPQTAKETTFKPDWYERAKAVLGPRHFAYIGQIFNTFLIVEKDNQILFIDQHAAHERILYNQISQNTDVQQLMVPYQFETDYSTDTFLSQNSFIYSEMGITLIRCQPMLWEITTIPAFCQKSEDKIAEYIRTATGDLEEIKKELFAVIACHKAIKAGEKLDSTTAMELLDKVFKLENLVCPHGRSFVYTITKDQLYSYVGRIV